MSEQLTEAERGAILDCDCGHTIGGEHNGNGCYGIVTYGPPIVRCGCTETDDRASVNFAAVEAILAARTAALAAENADLRARVETLVSALDRTEHNLRLAVQGKPVRDMAENLAENAAALASAPEGDRAAPANHDHGPTAKLLDPVYCLTCSHTHIATIPAVTFVCDSCGFGSWGHSVAAAHADSYADHVVYPCHHATTCLAPTPGPRVREDGETDE